MIPCMGRSRNPPPFLLGAPKTFTTVLTRNINHLAIQLKVSMLFFWTGEHGRGMIAILNRAREPELASFLHVSSDGPRSTCRPTQLALFRQTPYLALSIELS